MSTATKTVVSGGLIATSNRLHVKITGMGMSDAKGKTIFEAGFKGKWLAEPDAPIRTLILPLMQELLDYSKYKDRDAFESDLALLKKYVDGLYIAEKVKAKD